MRNYTALILLACSLSLITSCDKNENQGAIDAQTVPTIELLTPEITLYQGVISDIEFTVKPFNTVLDLSNIQYTPQKPTYFSIKSVQRDKSKAGQYSITIEDKGVNKKVSETLQFTVPAMQNNGKVVNITSDTIVVHAAHKVSLPKVYINTPGAVSITSKTEWTESSSIKIYDEEGNQDLNATTSIRGRGNSTWWYPKKPYALKLDSKAEILGMPKHKRWVLLANWMDRTLMRNDIAFEIARRIMEWAPRGKFVELYLNNKHLGCYYLCEQIKVDKNRVNVDELDEDTDFTDAEQVTGGYILEFDVYGPQDEINYYYTSVKGYPVAIKEPDEEVITSWSHPGFTYISGYTNSVEQLLEADKNSRSRWSGISDMIDINSYIDWWLVHELTLNWEPGHPKSSYMYKKRSGKLYAGPVWDFDWGTFSSNYTDPIITESLWYGYLFKYPEFKTAVKQRWNEVKSSCESIDQYISEIAAQIKDSNEANIKMWPIDGTTNGDENLSFDKAIERMKESYKTRLRVMDNFISGL